MENPARRCRVKPQRLLLLLATILFAWPVIAQVDRATLNGTVTDASGAIVQRAKVEAISAGTGLRREVLTGGSGTYSIPGLAIGQYTVTISHDGFKTAAFQAVELFVGQTRTLDAQLEVGALASQVEVTATVEAVNRSSAEIGGVIGT